MLEIISFLAFEKKKKLQEKQHYKLVLLFGGQGVKKIEILNINFIENYQF